MAPSYKEKLIEAESRLRKIVESSVISDIRNAKLSFLHKTVATRTASLLSTIRSLALKREYRLDTPRISTALMSEWLADSIKGVDALNEAEKFILYLDQQLEEERSKREELTWLSTQLLKHIETLEDAIRSDPDSSQLSIAIRSMSSHETSRMEDSSLNCDDDTSEIA